MKTKIIIFAVLIIFFTPLISSAMIVPPINLTVTVNTQGQDGLFNYDLKQAVYEYDEATGQMALVWQDYQSFALQTENLTKTESQNFVIASKYWLTQQSAPGLKINNILCLSDKPNDLFFYLSDGVIITPQDWSHITCTFNNIKATTRNPVLIVPGLLGTEVKNGNELLWVDLGRMFADVGDGFMDSLQLDDNLMSINANLTVGNIIGSPAIGQHFYDLLITEFKNQGYIESVDEDATLFTFPYDWRYGVSGKYADGITNSDLLAQKIQDIMAQTGSDKVDVVAHSLGGLIVKKYVMDNPADNHIRKAVFIGVPNTGAPKALKVLLQGDNFGVPWLADQEIKKISENLPASYDLLPDEQYYNIKGSFVSLVDIGYGIGEPTKKDLNYQEFKNYLNDKELNSTATANSGNLHNQTFDNFDLRTAGLDLYNIVGCKTATMDSLVEVRYKDIFGNNNTDYERVEFKIGDGTVPLESATNLPINQENKYYSLVSDHGKMPSQNGIRQQIVNLISGSSLNVGNNLITQNIDECQLNGKAISVFSPIDIGVTDQNGNKMGLAEDQSVINEIPNGDFEIWGEHKFVYLPTDNGQTYSINIKGTGSGTYTIKAEDIANSQTIKTEVFSNLPVTADLTGQISINPADNATTVLVKQNTNGLPATILPTSTLNGPQVKDLLPPISTATLTGVLGQPGFYRSDVSASINATDSIIVGRENETSGVLDIEYNLDNQGYQKVLGNTTVISIAGEGEHTITFFVTDKAGNNEQEQTIVFTIDKTPPEAVIEFDLANKDLKFTSIGSAILIFDNENIITLTDQSGNTTEITLKDKDRKRKMKAEIKSIKYNGVPSDISKNAMAYSWLYNKKKNLETLSQRVQSKKNYNVLAVFNGKNTKITGRDSSGKISQTFSGLKIVKTITDKGDLEWGY